MNPRVLRRFITYMFVAILVTGASYFVWQNLTGRAPGDYYTEVGGNRLRDGQYDKALRNFDLALKEQPDHRGALMGRALVFIARKQYPDAIAELDYLIKFLTKTLEADDKTGRAVLAAAYANRGIVHDRQGRYKKALKDYSEALRIDAKAVEGPGLVDKILYGNSRPSTIRDRAKYIYEQLKLPKEKRLMRVPARDAKERPYKP